MPQKVGFMGLGIMGSAMAANVLKAGFPITVYNRNPEKAQALIRGGARLAPSPRALAQASEVIIVMVTGPEAVNELLWGPEGAASALGPTHSFINMSSVAPAYTRELAGKLAPSGVTFIDAPVSGSKKPAEDATLLILAGGLRERVEALSPIFSAMGKKVIYCGDAGRGSMMKMMINLLLGAMMEGLAESLNFGKRGGLDLEAMLDVVLSGPLSCGLFQGKADMFRQDAFPVQFPFKHMTKDLKFVVDTAYDTGAPVPTGHALLQVYRAGLNRNLGDLDVAAVMKALEMMS